MKKNKIYELVDFCDCTRPEIYPVDWKDIPTELIEKLPGYYINNDYAITESGEITKKSVVYMAELEKRIECAYYKEYVDNDGTVYLWAEPILSNI